MLMAKGADLYTTYERMNIYSCEGGKYDGTKTHA